MQYIFFPSLKGHSKALVCGGIEKDACEILDLESSATICKNLPDFPADIRAAIGGLGFKETPIICGGIQNETISNRCYSLENTVWVSSASMNSVRTAAAAAQLKDGKILVTGGYDGSDFLNSAEVLTKKGWERNIPPLPVTLANHCMVTVNSSTVMVIGGRQNGQIYSGKTFYFTFGEESWTEGPELKIKREFHSCGKIRKNRDSQGMSIIVAGGFDGSLTLSSVEILNEGSNEWQTGPEMPFGITLSKMLEDPSGGVILIGGVILNGGESSVSIGYLDFLYQLPHGGQDAAWTKMEQKLTTGRLVHMAFLIPDNIVDCS